VVPGASSTKEFVDLPTLEFHVGIIPIKIYPRVSASRSGYTTAASAKTYIRVDCTASVLRLPQVRGSVTFCRC
jgi:hypothetical protein